MASTYSLKQRLLFALLAGVATVWLATVVYSYVDARHEINELLDAHLAQSASLIMAQAEHELDEIELEHAPRTHERATRVAFQVWDGGTVLRLHSDNAPDIRLAAREDGYSSARIGATTWRVFSSWDTSHRYLVQVGEREDARREIASQIVPNLVLPLLVALPLLGLFIWLSIGRALRPLSRLGREVEQRKADDFGVLAARDIPGEIVPLVRSLNTLFERVGRLVENERRFTADAAHELRTPLAALKTQAQVARGASDEHARLHALDSVIAGCDRASRLVDQLLTLARLDPDDARPVEACELGRLARQVIAELAPAALARQVEIELYAATPASVMGHADLISILLRNLVDNAVRYSPPGATVRVAVADARITVTDEGPGIAPDQRAKVGQRFYRILGTVQTGSGLGLSIVRRIAQIHAAELLFDEPQGGKGLRVSVAFPVRAS